jgi:hypothetical protein
MLETTVLVKFGLECPPNDVPKTGSGPTEMLRMDSPISPGVMPGHLYDISNEPEMSRNMTSLSFGQLLTPVLKLRTRSS